MDLNEFVKEGDLLSMARDRLDEIDRIRTEPLTNAEKAAIVDLVCAVLGELKTRYLVANSLVSERY